MSERLLYASVGLVAMLFMFLAASLAMSSLSIASERYEIGQLVKRDDVFACRTLKLALKIQKLGIAPENYGAVIENNDCYFLDRFDHIPQKFVLRANELSVYETLHAAPDTRLGTMYIIVP
ncbi:MAG: hypothetical protein N4A65_12850 [Cohaesibacter sp.]|nr:hypothetical protein [Cohaesibacter sp.]